METPETLAERLGNVRHFLKLPLSDRLAIILAGQMRLFSPDTVIFSEEEPCSGMFVLLKGHVHICKLGLKGQQSIIADIDPVIMFNEVALLDGGPNPYTAIATQNCFAWQISRPAYQKLLHRFGQDQYTEVSLGLLGIMASRYRQLLNSYADLSFLTVPDRVAKLIYELSEQGQVSINRRENSINEMAAHITSAPEAISRALTILKLQGIITTTRATITVIEPEELAKLAHTVSRNLFIYGSRN
jgi:CRP/FNR family transcriptional regulator, cyclic AMP receptor protein